MAKPEAVEWLESETGQTIDITAEATPTEDRHLSVRVSRDLADGLSVLADERGQSLSQLVPNLLKEAVAQRQAVAALDAKALAERLAVDVVEVRRRLAG